MQKIFDLIEYIMQILYGSLIWRPANFLLLSGPAKGQSNSERIYEVIVSPKIQTKNYKYFCPTIQTRIVALFWWGDFLGTVCSFFGNDPCLFGRAEIFVILCLHFGRNDDL